MDTMRQRILVVDDDPSLAEMLTIVLRGEGFDTAVIGDGTQALTAVRELRLNRSESQSDCTPEADRDRSTRKTPACYRRFIAIW